MDKDKCGDNHSQCSWMEIHQFIGDLIASGSSMKDQPDVLNAAWGVAAGGADPLFKGASLAPLEPHRPAHDKSDPGRQIQPGPSSQRKGGSRARREDMLYACTCPGCPCATSPPAFDIVNPRQSLSSTSRSDAAYHRGYATDAEPSSSTNASALGTRTSDRPQRGEAERGAQGPDTPHSRASTSSLSHLSMFPCLCCHRSLQNCSQLLSHQEGTDSPFSHTHAHHHFHHHHCPLTSCLVCPQLVRPHAPQFAGPFSCLSCQRSFPASAQECHHHQHRPATHSAQHQEERGRAALNLPSHPCMHCSASFPRPSQLLHHQHSEHAHKPSGFICPECGRTFNSHSNLRIHLNVHTGARPYSCADCGKCFSQSGALKIHRRIHTGERPYSCAFCGRGFPHLAGVRAHQRTHTGERPYRCIQCGKGFTQSGALKIHIRIHTGERPFICSVCGKGFSNRSGIRFHYRTVHGLAPEHVVEAGAGGASGGPAGHRRPPGRPRSFNSGRVGLNSTFNSSDSHTALNPRGSPASTAAAAAAPPGSAALGSNESTSQSEGEHPSSDRQVLLYACEDCGLLFKDAPSRNRHQTLMHYPSGGREEEEDQRRELGTSESVCDTSGE